jgi:hypothetical protein
MAVKVNASFKLTGWNATQLKLRVPIILTTYGKVLDQQLKAEIKTVQFSWPRSTRRRNKTTVSSPRDIVDLGGFLRSQRRDRPSATELRFTWDAKNDKGFPYAPLILTGYTTSRGTVVPGRNWIKPALAAQPLDRFFAAEWRKLANNGL